MRNIICFYLLFGVLCSISAAGNICTYKVLAGAYISGWVSGYVDVRYPTFKEAKKVCDDNIKCKGITQGYPTVSADKWNIGVNAIPFFTLRGTTIIIYHQPGILIREISYFKETCIPCDYSVAYGTYLSGCADQCKDYTTIESAQDACRSLASCGGVTLSKKYIGGPKSTNPVQGKFGFQLRAISQTYASPT